MLHRLFPWDRAAPSDAPGGAGYNARPQQGAGRHDNPTHYGALYLSRDPVSALAEWLHAFRGHVVEPMDLQRGDGREWALATFDDSRLEALIDLDDPRTLVARARRPSEIAARRRVVTQPIALALFAEGGPGFAWWSTLNAEWTNVTLFAERALSHIQLAAQPESVAVDHPALRAAAELLGIELSG